MKIPELFQRELTYWTNTNQKFIGISPIDENDNFEDIQKQLDKDCETYWNVDEPCKLAKALNLGILNRDIGKQTPKSYQLKLNFYNMCTNVLAEYEGKMLVVACLPTPCNDLCWIINRSHYVPRVTAMRDYYSCVGKYDFETVRGEGWTYNITDDEFNCVISKDEYKFEPEINIIFEEHLSNRSKLLLSTLLEKEVTVDNFREALKKLPVLDRDSIFNYKFSRMEYFEDIVINSNKYASPLKKIPLPVNTLIASKNHIYTKTGTRLEGCIIRSESRIFALENFRTCVNIYNAENNTTFKPAFTYTDINGFFDSFKTVTNQNAGRQRLLLDNVVVNDGILWIEEDGTLHNMYEYLDMPQDKRLSCLSEAPFCNNDKPKRIMMNAKMTSQAVPLAQELDNITHRITARVGFTDLGGYNAADSIVISQSLADRLRTWEEEILYLDVNSKKYKAVEEGMENGFGVAEMQTLFPKKNLAMIINCENIGVDKIDFVTKTNVRVFMSWEIPFNLGDKLTNLHGAKGTVGLILPDEEMPQLLHKVGNMEPGPLEIVLSGFSTMRRGTLGQIFEAWALAEGIPLKDDGDFVANVMDKYEKEMKIFSENSIVEYKGEQQIIPVGYNYIMRLNHHTSTKVSLSSADYGYNRTLRLGEMEKLNLVANDCPNILKELGIRSVTKYFGSHKLINDIEEYRKLPEKTKLNLRFLEILKSIGYKMTIEQDEQDIELSDDDIKVYNDTIVNKETQNYKQVSKKKS